MFGLRRAEAPHCARAACACGCACPGSAWQTDWRASHSPGEWLPRARIVCSVVCGLRSRDVQVQSGQKWVGGRRTGTSDVTANARDTELGSTPYLLLVRLTARAAARRAVGVLRAAGASVGVGVDTG